MSNPKNGYDGYLEFQFREASDFFGPLFRAISSADGKNLERIALGFPEEVEAYKTWTRIGVEEFLAKCNPEHHLIKALAEGKIAI